MKEWMIIVIVITIILWIVFFPKKESYTFVHQEEMIVESFEINLQGAVNKPGVYVYYEPMRLEEIVKFAMGFTKEVDLNKIDLSKVYSQNSDIYIPSIEEDDIMINEKININKANFQTLLTIPGIQERQAAAIIVYREANGLFTTLDELLNVNYIGPKSLEKIKPYVSLG